MIYLDLLWSFVKVGLFSVGGGYVAMPLIQNQTVAVHAWLTNAEFANLVAIAEMTPGPMVLNAATFVGLRVGGLAGAITATIGCVLPSIVIVSILAKLYMKFKSGNTMKTVLACLRPAVIALIISALISIFAVVFFSSDTDLMQNINWKGVGLFLAAFLAIVKFKVNPVIAMLSAGGVNLLIALITGSV